MLKINKHIAVLLTLQMILSQVAFAAESLDADSFAVEASKALQKNDFSDLENGSATFNYSDNSKAYVKVSDLTVNTTADDSSTSTVKLGKQYEVCSVSADSRTVSCNYTTVRSDGSKDTKSLDIDNTAEHQIYSVPANATFTDPNKQYFVTSYDNPYYKFRSIDESGHISGTNCIKLNNSNSMVCSADASIDISKLSASDFSQIDDTNKYQVNQDKLTNAMFANSNGSCSIDGWVQADATHCCPPNTDEYTYTWDTAQQQCKVTKHHASKENKNNLLKDLLSAGAIFAGGMTKGKDKQTQDDNKEHTQRASEYQDNIVFQQSSIDSNAKINIKFNPTIPVASEELKATISVNNTESDKLIIRIQAPSTKINTLTAKSDKEFTLISANDIEPGTYKLIVYVMNDGQRKATFSANFEVFDATLVLTDEQKKQYTNIQLEPISEKIEKFNIYGDVSNVRYDEENEICSFDVTDGYAQTGDTKAFKVEQSMPVEISTDKEDCEKLNASQKAYIEDGLLLKDGNRLGVVVSDKSFVLTDTAEVFATEKSNEKAANLINQTAVELGDVSTLHINDEHRVVGVSFDEDNNVLLTDAQTGDVYSLSEYEEAFNLESGSLVVMQNKIDDNTTISRVVVSDDTDRASRVFVEDAFNKKSTEMTDTVKKASTIRDFTINMLNSVEFKKKEKENTIVKSVKSCLDRFGKGK